MKNVLLLLLMMAVFVSVAQADLHRVRNDGTNWVQDVMNTNTYTALTAVNSATVFAAGASGVGLDKVGYGAGWETTDVSANVYHDISYSGVHVFAAGGTGVGLDRVAGDGAWVNDLSDNVYTSISATTNDIKVFAAGGAGVGLDVIDWVAGDPWWTAADLNSNIYNDISFCGVHVFAAGGTGVGLDRVAGDGGGWQNDVVDNVYTSIAAIGSSGIPLFGAGGAGVGLDKIDWLAGDPWWTAADMNAKVYLDIDTDGAGNAYGILAGGGMDRIYHDGTGWVTEQISSATYTALSVSDDGFVFGAQVPEPATMSLLALGGLALLRRKRS